MGAAPSRRAARAIAAAGVSYAVDLRADISVGRLPWPDTVQVFSCPLVEYEAPDLPSLLELTKQIAALIESGETVYVHCRAGLQRAPMVACAVLVQMGWTLADAFRLVSSRRGITAMNEAQLVALRTLDAEVGRAGAATAPRKAVQPGESRTGSMSIPGHRQHVPAAS
jgi:hypothetical protein